MNINEKTLLIQAPAETVLHLNREPAFLIDYFKCAVALGYFQKTGIDKKDAQCITVDKLQTLRDIPSDVEEISIVRLGKVQNKKIIDFVKKLQRARKRNEDIITQCTGSFGKWQLGMSFALFMCEVPIAWHLLSIVMIGPDVKFNCTNSRFEPCDENCPSHEFDVSIFSETITTKWNLVCERLVFKDLAQSITMFGVLIGNVVWGIISDKFGRRYPLMVEVLLQGTAGLLAAFSPWFWFFNLMRFLASFATGGSMITSFVLLMEIIGVKYRTIIGILYTIPFYLGHLSLPLIGYLCSEWRCIQIAISAPSLLFIAYYWIVPESPRWLCVQKEFDKAAEVLKGAAKINGMSTEDIDLKVQSLVNIKHPLLSKSQKGSAVDLFRTRIMRKYTIILCYNWIVSGLCYYGVAQFSGNLGGDLFISVAISAVMQVPSTLFACWSTTALGRRWSMILANLLGGVGMLSMLAIPERLNWINYINLAVAMCGFALGFPIIYVYSGEIFPTNLRNIGVGMSSMTGRFGSIIAPHIASFDKVQYWWLPPLIFGIIPLLGAFLCLFLPETLDWKLPDTVEETETAEKEKIAFDNEMRANIKERKYEEKEKKRTEKLKLSTENEQKSARKEGAKRTEKVRISTEQPAQIPENEEEHPTSSQNN